MQSPCLRHVTFVITVHLKTAVTTMKFMTVVMILKIRRLFKSGLKARQKNDNSRSKCTYR